MENQIDGFGISSFRSFDDEVQYIGPCSKINLIIGQNNSGKSNILSFIDQYYNKINRSFHNDSRGSLFTGLDLHRGLITDQIPYTTCVSKNNVWLNSARGNFSHDTREKILPKLWEYDLLTNDTDFLWIPLIFSKENGFTIKKNFCNEIRNVGILTDNEWGLLWNDLRSVLGQLRFNEDPVFNVMVNLAINALTYPQTLLIPAMRKIDPNNPDEFKDMNELGIIDLLDQLQNPNFDQQNDKEVFERINRFLRDVTNNSSANLEIPHNKGTILVHMDGKTLPLSSLGTGIHELIILAAEATVRNNFVICIEEPELHMHPLLQKRLIEYLGKETNNQYFISTHSAHILDSAINASIFHIYLENGSTRVKAISSNTDKFSICQDLGYHASDILQTNCIIWVEGPSDRIYLKWWIEAKDSKLIEGIHYSIMFYGGRLLNHLSADDSEVNEFIALRKLNMNLAILIDSDKDSEHTRINETKKRIKSELDSKPGFVWITDGREIENYIDPNVFSQAISSIYSDKKIEPIISKFSDSMRIADKNGKIVPPDKIKIANEIIKSPADFTRLDLNKQMNSLVEFINKANA